MAENQHSIFIGYRRDDTADASGRVFDRLYQAFGAGQVFKDVDNLPVGVDFGQHILTILPRCRVFMAMIGPRWIDAADETGGRRLESPDDWVRIEIETALATDGLQVVPVLINGAPMPRADQLPESLRELVRLNAAIVRRDPDFHKDMDKLINALREGLATGRRVEVEQAAPQSLTGSAAAWKEHVEGSLHLADYEDFITHFPGTPEVMLASKCRRQLEAWGQLDLSDPDALSAFLESGPFEALAAKVRQAQAAAQKARQEAFEKALAERRGREAAKAEARRKAEEERRAAEEAARKAQEELDRRLGPTAAKARHAAVSGGAVSERVFRLDLASVDNWPKPDIVAIPPGTFLMGSPIDEEERDDDEGPQHEVRIDYPFALGKHTVTFAEWDAAVAAGAKLEKPEDEGWGRGERPVIYVNWDDVQAYLDWLNEKAGLAGKSDPWRLPSEAEWEYACRAGTTTPFSFGETISTAQANYRGNHTYGAGRKGKYLKKTVPVGSYPSNAYGLHDMHGNVWEWCDDPWRDTYEGAPSDGSVWKVGGDASRRVLRGGSWNNYPQDLRSASRDWYFTGDRISYIGFRLARTL